VIRDFGVAAVLLLAARMVWCSCVGAAVLVQLCWCSCVGATVPHGH
jgi:hypothetical protein